MAKQINRSISENKFSERRDGYEYFWDVSTLIQFCKEKEYKTFDMPIAGIYTGGHKYDCNSFNKFIDHCDRVANANLDYPIILDDEGYIADGWHRVCKAKLQSIETIKAIRMLEMPPASKVEKIIEES